MIAFICYAEFHQNLETRIITNLDLLITEYDPQNSNSTTYIDNLQQNWQCCGTNQTDIWLDILIDKYPKSCCDPKLIITDELSENDEYETGIDSIDVCYESQLFDSNCADVISGVIWRSAFTLSIILVVFVFLEIVSLVLTALTLRKLDAMTKQNRSRTLNEHSSGDERSRMMH